MRQPLVAGNWKMNGSRSMAEALARTVNEGAKTLGCEVVLCPPAAYLSTVGPLLTKPGVGLGAQDCSEHDSGAYTGEHATSMLDDLGCTYVIIGHSERRQMFGDSDERVVEKVLAALANGLSPILCVGESLAERQAGTTETVVAAQLNAVLHDSRCEGRLQRLVVAYEPVWAIGTGESATPEQAQAVHAFLRRCIDDIDPALAKTTRLLYGGSVKPENAAQLFASPDIDGGLIGDASLKAESFLSICAAAG